MRITINNIDVTQYATLPISTALKLDESLDGNVLVLKGTQIKSAFEPLDLVIISYDDGTEERWLVATDTCQRQITGKKNFYTHNINLIEETKKLEGEPCCTMTFTNQLYGVDIQEQTVVNPIITGGYDKVNNAIRNANPFNTPISNTKPFFISSPYQFFKNMCGLMVFELGQTMGYVETPDLGSQLGKTQSFTIPQGASTGTYRVVYIGSVWYPGDTVFAATNVRVEYVFEMNSAQPYLAPKKTISDVVSLILLKHKTLNSYESVKYYFNEEQKEKYSKILAPEFTITQGTLFEALKTVASYVHCFPRLKGNEIYFDELNTVEIVDTSNEDVLYNNSQSIDNYCDSLGSYVNNITNQQGDSGSVFEPDNTSFKTVRCEQGNFLIEDGTVVINTQYPILKINKLSLLKLDVPTGETQPIEKIIDVTQYVYEYNKYSLLSSYQDNVYNSKAYAIYYKQGQKNVYGLNFKDNTEGLPAVFKKYAIVNIVNNILNKNETVDFLGQFAFQVEYVPLVDLRVIQHKSYLAQSRNERNLVYNQSENIVDSKAYGEYLKGTVERLGNNEKQLTFITKTITNIPKIGKNTQYGYISEINIERYKSYLKYSIAFTKDFNRISQYIGIKSNIRQYEISEAMTQERYCVYEDFLVVGNAPLVSATNENKPLLTNVGLRNLRHIFYGDDDAKYGIHCSNLGIDESNGTFLVQLEEPIISYSLGNSAVFYISMEDNFSAGTQSLTPGGSTAISSTRRINQPVQYSSNIGEFDTFKLNLKAYGSNRSTYNDKIIQGNNFPKLETVYFTEDQAGLIFSTLEDMNILIYKDNRENIKFSYQLNCITDKENVIIGSGMSKIFTNNSSGYLVGYILNRKISKFENIINTDGLTPFYNFKEERIITIDTEYKSLTLPDKVANKQGKSLVFVDSETNELLWGENIDINIGDTITPSVISFRHKKRI